jgi:hypothetical protein
MRQTVGPKKIARYRRETGLPVVKALVRGDTHHRIDLYLEDGTVMCWYRRTGEIENRANIKLQ